VLVLGSVLPLAFPAQPGEDVDSLYSVQPAAKWQEALVTGNGTMGVLVFGQPDHEQIIFNHERLYEPLRETPVSPPRIARYMPEIRKRLLAGDTESASQYAMAMAKQEGYPGLLWTDRYHPAFVMHLDLVTRGQVTDYRRAVNFATGEITVSWKDDLGPCERKVFVSRADQTVVQMIQRPNGTVDMTVRVAMQDPRGKGAAHAPLVQIQATDHELLYRGSYTMTTRGYEGLTRVVAKEGTCQAQDGTIKVTGANQVVMLTKIASLEDKSLSQVDALRASLEALSSFYGILLRPHVAMHQPIYERVALNLNGGKDRALSTEALIAKQKESSGVLPALLEKVFNMGRFAFLCASGEWPPNLMGLWNGEWHPAWSGDFTLDANLNLQMSACNIGAMPEAMQSYTNLITHLLPDWRMNAWNLYGCRGVLSGTRTDGRHNLNTHASEGFPGFFWTAGAEWLTLPMIEYYEVTGDLPYLRTVLYPLVREIALFYEDFLVETRDNGQFVFVPSYSPENTPSNKNNSACINATMDIAAAKEALTYAVRFARTLQCDQYKVVTWEAMLAKCPPYLVNRDGALKEWADPDWHDRYNHRHVSHLYPVWPGHEINPEDTPALFEAARIAAQKRGRGNGSAHGLAHMALIGTRLKDADLVNGNLKFMLSNDYLLPSLFTFHNPGTIYNSDMLCSLPAVVMEMLVYSRPGVVELLPALGHDMAMGAIQGVLCRGQIRMDRLAWNLNLKTIKAEMTSQVDQTVTLIVRREIESLQVNGRDVTVQDGKATLTLPRGKSVTVDVRLN
jgi:hypothetical protein